MTQKLQTRILAVTLGDPGGIGPEKAGIRNLVGRRRLKIPFLVGEHGRSARERVVRGVGGARAAGTSLKLECDRAAGWQRSVERPAEELAQYAGIYDLGRGSFKVWLERGLPKAKRLRRNKNHEA